MTHFKKTILQVIAFAVAFATMPAVAETVEAKAAEASARIAVISGVHVPHQGFALSASVPTDRMCVELAQNLASELGIVVHVVCTDPTGGDATIVGESGYADKPDAQKVESFSHSWRHNQFLVCVPPDTVRVRAQRVTPNLDALRPTPSLSN